MWGLVCPACRHLDAEGRLVVRDLLPAAGDGACLACPGCGQSYPVIDGIPVVVPELDAYLAAEAPALMARGDLPPATAARILAPAEGPLRRDADICAMYAQNAESPLYDWAAGVAARFEGEALQVGGGLHGLGLEAALHLDLNFSLLRRLGGPGWRRVVGDALNPPLRGGRFGGVVALNLLDSCREPWLLLQQIDALLAEGGQVALSCAFAWSAEVTAPHQQISEAQLHRFFEARRYEVVWGEQEWVLRRSARSESRYRPLTVHARKARAV